MFGYDCSYWSADAGSEACLTSLLNSTAKAANSTAEMAVAMIQIIVTNVNYKFPLMTIISTVLWLHPSYSVSPSGMPPYRGADFWTLFVLFSTFLGLFGPVSLVRLTP
jgi:hypothetical protein